MVFFWDLSEKNQGLSMKNVFLDSEQIQIYSPFTENSYDLSLVVWQVSFQYT